MPSEQLPAHTPHTTQQGSAEQLQHPPSRGGVRMLLGLPCSDFGTLSTAALTAPPGRQRYGQSPLPAPEESHEGFEETPDEGVIAEARGAGADFPALRRDGTPFSQAGREHAAAARVMPTALSAEQREPSHLVIPGVSTHRTAFPALSRTADTPTLSTAGEPQHAIPPQTAPLSAPASPPQARQVTTVDVELLTRLAQLVTAGTRTQQDAPAWPGASAPLSPAPVEPIRLPNAEAGDQDLAQRFAQLQRTVHDLAATVSSQAARHSDDSQAQRRARQTPPRQRRRVMNRADEPSTTPRAFWQRRRLGRLALRTGR
jgi:hypothetical protein